jgi:hypothetical protein
MISRPTYVAPQPAQIGSKDLAQIHALSKAVRCTIDRPLHTNKN